MLPLSPSLDLTRNYVLLIVCSNIRPLSLCWTSHASWARAKPIEQKVAPLQRLGSEPRHTGQVSCTQTVGLWSPVTVPLQGSGPPGPRCVPGWGNYTPVVVPATVDTYTLLDFLIRFVCLFPWLLTGYVLSKSMLIFLLLFVAMSILQSLRTVVCCCKVFLRFVIYPLDHL